MTNTSPQPTPQEAQNQLDQLEAARLQLEAAKAISCGIVVITLAAVCAITVMLLGVLFFVTKDSADSRRNPPPALWPYP